MIGVAMKRDIQTTSATTHKIAIGFGIAAAAAAGVIVAAADLAFRFALDTTSRQAMDERLERLGIDIPADDTYPQTASDIADADWFDESRQPITLTSDDGLTLHGWLFDPDCAHPTDHLYAICCHGYTGEPAEMARYAHHYAAMGFTVLTPAMRAHELSEGRYIGMGWLEYHDLMRWIGLVVDGDPEARILLHGNSMGGAAVMMAAGDPSLPRNVIAAIEDSGYASAWDQFLSSAKTLYHLPKWLARPFIGCMSLFCRYRAGYRFRDASCVRALRHTTIPMLFIHGGADDFVSPVSLDRNYAACSSIDRQRMLVPGAGHTQAASVDPERYWRKIEHFVHRVFHLE